ncbi:MAG: hypothetical protein ACKPE6_15935, partial [Gammaproteobacteria bacterium]
MVDPGLAEFIHDDRCITPCGVGKQRVQQARLSAAQKSCQQRDRGARLQKGASPGRKRGAATAAA